MWVTWVTWLPWVQHLSIRLGFRLLARLGLACWCGPIHEVLKVGIGHILQHGGWDCDHLGRMFEDHPQGVAGRLRGATSCIDGSRHQAMPRITNSTHAIPGWLTIWGIDGPKRTMHIAWWQGKGHLDIFVVPLIPKYLLFSGISSGFLTVSVLMVCGSWTIMPVLGAAEYMTMCSSPKVKFPGVPAWLWYPPSVLSIWLWVHHWL